MSLWATDDKSPGPIYWWGVLCSACAWLVVIVSILVEIDFTIPRLLISGMMLALLAGTSWGGVGLAIGIICMKVMELTP